MTSSPSHDELPLPDYDHLPLGSVQHRIRTLDTDQLQSVRAYELEHGNRAPVLTVIDARLDDLRSGAEPSAGSPDAAQPESAPPAVGGSTVSPETSGPPMNPPSHGTPINPAQPRSTG
jgi:hypothetical protein